MNDAFEYLEVYAVQVFQPELLFCSSKWVCIRALPSAFYHMENNVEKESHTEPTAFFFCLQKVRQIKADKHHSVSSAWICSAWCVWDYSWNPWPQDSYDRGTISDTAETFIPLLMQGWRWRSHEWCERIVLPCRISIWQIWSRRDDFIWKVR